MASNSFAELRDELYRANRSTQLAVGSRVALRATASLGRIPFADLGQVILPNVRATITAASVAQAKNEKLRLAADRAAEGSSEQALSKAHTLGYPCTQAAFTASSIAYAAGFQRNSEYDGDAFEAVVQGCRYFEYTVNQTAARRDLDIGNSTVPHAIFLRPLWPNGSIPKIWKDPFLHLSDFWSLEEPIWSFWQRWYEGMLKGDPLPWELQRQVALIDNAIWDAGPEAVAEEIARIEARFEVLRRIEELEAERDALKANRFGVGGNQPPEPIEDPELAKQVTIIWDATNTVKKEAEKDQPDKTIVESALGTMIAALKWIWERIESAADSAVALVMGIYIGNPAAVERVVEAIKDWLLTF